MFLFQFHRIVPCPHPHSLCTIPFHSKLLNSSSIKFHSIVTDHVYPSCFTAFVRRRTRWRAKKCRQKHCHLPGKNCSNTVQNHCVIEITFSSCSVAINLMFSGDFCWVKKLLVVKPVSSWKHEADFESEKLRTLSFALLNI
jgi:hypothetical protein